MIYDLTKRNDKHLAQVVIKLLMNSMYGTTIIKPIEADTIIKVVEMILRCIFHLVVIILIMC